MKILVTIISSEKHLDSRIKIIQDTWLKDFENYLIISDYDDKENHTVKVTDNKTYESAILKEVIFLSYEGSFFSIDNKPSVSRIITLLALSSSVSKQLIYIPLVHLPALI